MRMQPREIAIGPCSASPSSDTGSPDFARQRAPCPRCDEISIEGADVAAATHRARRQVSAPVSLMSALDCDQASLNRFASPEGRCSVRGHVSATLLPSAVLLQGVHGLVWGCGQAHYRHRHEHNTGTPGPTPHTTTAAQAPPSMVSKRRFLPYLI